MEVNPELQTIVYFIVEVEKALNAKAEKEKLLKKLDVNKPGTPGYHKYLGEYRDIPDIKVREMKDNLKMIRRLSLKIEKEL